MLKNHQRVKQGRIWDGSDVGVQYRTTLKYLYWHNFWWNTGPTLDFNIGQHIIGTMLHITLVQHWILILVNIKISLSVQCCIEHWSNIGF